MPTVVVSFRDENEARQAIAELAQVGVGEIRARVVDNSQPLSYEQGSASSAMIDPSMGSIEVRSSETPEVPGANTSREGKKFSGSVPVTGGDDSGVLVMVEFDQPNEEAVRKILAGKKGTSQEPLGEK